MNKSLVVAALLSAFSLTGFVPAASAVQTQTTWQKHHPRRVEVNKRLAHQNARIAQQVKEGEMTKAEAARLHKDDRQIRQEERDMAAQNGSHLTKLDQRVLNQQENRVGKQIGQ